MPYDPEQLAVDVDYLTTLPQWQDEAKRPEFIRQVALQAGPNLDPQAHGEFANALWERSKGNVLQRGAEFVARGGEEVLKSIPASGGAAVFAASDALGITDTGSGTRLKRGVADLVDATGQRLKQLGGGEILGMNLLPGQSKQAVRDQTLDALKQSLDQGLYPAGLERWMTGEFDAGDVQPDAETQQWIDLMTRGIAERAVAADHMGKVKPEKVREWLQSDRNPAFADSDIPGQPGPRELLADYLATRDPSSWEAFQARVSETDSQRTTRLRRFAAEGEMRATTATMPEGLGKDLAVRSMDMQTSPIDLASAALPIFRGRAALQAARRGGAGAQMLRGMGAEGLQEGATEYLSDPNASPERVLEAAGLGAVGQGVVSAPMAGAGALLRRRDNLSTNDPTTSPNQTPAPTQPPAPGQPGAPAPMAPGAPGPAAVSPLIGIAQRGGAVDVTLPEDTGELTAEEVQDLETGRRRPILQGVPDQVPQATPALPPTPTLPPSQSQGVGGGVRGGEGFSDILPPAANPDPAQTITGSNVQTGTEMPVPPPTAEAGAGAGAVEDGQPVSQAGQAVSQPVQESIPSETLPLSDSPSLENASVTIPGSATAESIIDTLARSEMDVLEADLSAIQKGRNNPKSPWFRVTDKTILAKRQRLAKLKANPVSVGWQKVVEALDEKLARNEPISEEWTRLFAGLRLPAEEIDARAKRAGYVRQGDVYIPPNASVTTPGPATTADKTAQQAGDAGSSPAAGAPSLSMRMTGREAASWVIRNKQTGEVIAETFDKTKVERLNQAKYEAVPIADYLATLNQAPGGQAFMLGQPPPAGQAVSEPVQTTIPSESLPVSESPSLDPNASVTQGPATTADQTAQQAGGAGLSPAAGESATPESDLTPGFQHLVIDRDLEAGFMSGAGVDALIDLAHRAFAAGRTFAQWAAAMVQRFGAAVRDYLAGVWDHAKRSSQTGALNFTSRLGEQLQRASQQAARPAATAAPLKAAYASALRGSSTAMVPLADVFAAAQAANPALTQEQFQAQVMADYEAGSLMLEGAGSPQEAQSAGLRIDGTPVGTAVRMMVPQGFTHLDVSGQRSQAGFVINPLPALQRLAARVLPLHERGEPFRVKPLGARAILTGSPLPSDVTQVLAMTENERQAVAQSAAQVGRDLQAAVKAYLDRTGQDERATWDKINAVMEGQPGALTLLTAIDPALGERSRRARNMLDDLSAAVAQTLPTGSLRDAITQNQGSWMRRGYAAFDPESGWNFDGLTKAAKAGRQIGGKDAAKILANARAYLRSQNPQNGRTLKEWNADIEADMRDLMDRNAWQSANLGGNTLRKNVSSFMRRKEIAPEIRALMGEETNPLHRFIKSAAFQAQIVARHHGQTAVRALGLQTGLFSTQRGGVYTEEIEPSENRWSGLAGVWTTPEMKAALANSSAVNREGTDLGGWLVGTVKALGNEAKLNRVALNPDSWVVNILGNVVGLVQSGDVFAWDFARRLTDARALIKSGKARPGSMQTAAESALIDAQRAMLARLRGMGVIGSSITLADIEASIPRHLLQWVAEDRARNTGLGAVKGAIMGQAAGRGLGLPGRVVGGVAGGIGGAIAGAQRLQNWQQNVADYVMTGPDALARVTGWLTNYETALAAGQNPDQAAADATTRTLNTFPNYNALPALLRQLSRLGFTGSFIAFQWEVYRNFGWNVKYAIEELSSGNAPIQARGLRRLAGIGSVAALAGGGLAALLGAAGAAASDDEERNKIWRQWFAAPWEKDAVLAFDKYDKQGVSYYNTSYLLPQMTMMELIQGASEGRDPADSASRVLNRLSEQFIAGSVHLQPLLSAFANQDRFGRRITNAEGLAGAAARVDVAAQTILEPGFADKITRLTYALRQAEKNGRKFSVEEEMKRLAGIRQVSRTWEELVKRRYSQFTYDYQGVRDDANKMLGQNLPGAPVRAVKMVNDKVIELEQQLADYERDLRRLGVPETTIKAAKKDSSLQRLNPVRVRADGRRVEAVTVR